MVSQHAYFFDEFDSNNFGWLKNFLAPMQDGKFKAGESTYRIGRAVFVFAGGVSESWKDFTEKVSGNKNSKGPDFVSRLRGHLDIASINGPRDPGAKPGDESANRLDRVVLIRRAVLLRSLLEVHLPDVLDKNSKEAKIDTEVVRAFLRVPSYTHEARSMQAILEMSRLSPRGALQKSSLPAPDQLAMHVDANEFFIGMERGRFRRDLPIAKPTAQKAAHEQDGGEPKNAAPPQPRERGLTPALDQDSNPQVSSGVTQKPQQRQTEEKNQPQS
jgi:hypothetical protein